ncbi:MAG: DUF1080 domain-containing protein [Chloroflexi bacterium]|nr:MAG: DUF1080 domain-containing protein [Chloroflexota bacterium]
MTAVRPIDTDLGRDVLARYVCNGLDEARASVRLAGGADGRPFDVIVCGGGSFGAAVARTIFRRDSAHLHRVLVLEAGPFVFTEHVQNLPLMGLSAARPTTLARLETGADPTWQQQFEVWGLPWRSDVEFPGLAYCVGGRSAYWGGWAPRLLASELTDWPAAVVNDLAGLYPEAESQTGVSDLNDFISGPLQDALRASLLAAIDGGGIPGAVPVNDLPDVIVAPSAGSDARALRLEAPLAVQTRAPSGLFPFNKFSAIPMLFAAARAAQTESSGDDARKRLMIVPRCHVTRLEHDGMRAIRVHTNQGAVDIPAGGVAILALGTIENTRVALRSFADLANAAQMGRNLMAHLRADLKIRIPRDRTGVDAAVRSLEAAALFVKGRTQIGGAARHFHLQITAAGLDAVGTDNELKLFRKIPDIEHFADFHQASDTDVVVTIRQIGEMEPNNPGSTVDLSGGSDELGEARAGVRIVESANDGQLRTLMGQAARAVAAAFAGGANNYQVISDIPDRPGSTHHEAGTLAMGTDPARSVTNPDGRFHAVANVYAIGPALFPTIGSSNPMLTGVALARRMASKIVPDPPPLPDDGFELLLGRAAWHSTGPQGRFISDGDTVVCEGLWDLGLYWCATPLPADFVLRLEWCASREDDNSGVLVRFPDPNSKGYQNPAWVATHFGYEIQIDALGAPDGAPMHRTGAIYAEPQQDFTLVPANPAGVWNRYEIEVRGDTYVVRLNGLQTTRFVGRNPARGRPSAPGAPTFVGLQAHPGHRVAFRHVRVRAA